MDQNNSNYVISIADFFAFLVKKFWILLIGALLGTALLLSFNFYSVSRAGDPASNIVAERTIGNLNEKLRLMDEVSKTGLVFVSNDLYCSKFIIVLDPVNYLDSSSKDRNMTNSNPSADFITIWWRNLDLSSLVHSEEDNDILKWSMTCFVKGTTAGLTVFSDSKDTAERYATLIRDDFSKYFVDSTWEPVIGPITTSKASVTDISDYFSVFSKEKASIQEEISETSKIIPEAAKPQIAKYSIFGFLLGGFVSIILLSCVFISRNPLASSYSTEYRLSLPFLGACFLDNDFFSKLARRIIGERHFKDKKEESQYLKAHFLDKFFVNSADVKRIVVISSSSARCVSTIAQDVCRTISESGFEVSFIGDSTNSPELNKIIENTDAVVVLEKQWKTKTQLARVNRDIALKHNKKVLGFILC